ncbi:thiamine pyrophosphate-requiring protein [Algicella marina]|uniref:Thiamine pyrophosphate-requiring protein n=1 Tax=Algicella marina TaxID=2683284 RepID=A0A6P1T3C8_9RHOB|nr:thiamine pyrophosphate-requiring protein [Algicella marina]QHQ36517.1 thiamine pyrophosphate-requiring protein [Algicella marina]
MTDANEQMTAGGAIFPRLKALGVDYVFANSGTDFPPIIEGLAEAGARGQELPQALVIPHEHAAMGMAHGYYLMTGRAQAVMLHTNVGLANGAIGAINAACEHIPMLLMSGRTPVTEAGRLGSRTVPIGWGQEMFDQAALVREACKWENELRFPEQMAPLLDRAHAIANSTPKGPVYLSLPREVLCEQIDTQGLFAPPAIQPSETMASPASIRAAAEMIADAKRPIVFAQRGLGSDEAFTAFGAWLEDWAIAYPSWWITQLALPTDHPCHIGPEPGHWLEEADVVVVINALAPWWPDKHSVNPDAKVIHIGPDPLFSRFPTRTFRSDLTLTGEVAPIMEALMAEMSDMPRGAELPTRRTALAKAAAAERKVRHELATASTAKGITKAYVSHCLGEVLAGETSTVLSELGTILGPLERREHLSWLVEPHSGGLGWSFPAALGAKLADPTRTVVATMGDGSYMFANPTVCHQIAEALELGILVIVLNNEEWGAVRHSVTGVYPDGFASRANRMPLTALKPSPDFTKTAEASRAWTRTVREPADVIPALEKALAATAKGRLALLDIRILPD